MYIVHAMKITFRTAIYLSFIFSPACLFCIHVGREDNIVDSIDFYIPSHMEKLLSTI